MTAKGSSHEVHVWRSWVETSSSVLTGMENFLGDDERMRAAKFFHERDRARYVFSKGRLRQILATYLTVRPDEVAFRTTEFGKPFLATPFESSGINFNVSHSQDLVVLAIAFDRQVGVDVEFVRPIHDFESVIERCFTNFERDLIARNPDSLNSFFQCWTRKEAVVKAIGKGLSLTLNSFDASPQGGKTSGPLQRLSDEIPGIAWWVSDLKVHDGYHGALVNEGDMPAIIYREWLGARL
jgi:4'-phosphopantetheinyl transferase